MRVCLCSCGDCGGYLPSFSYHQGFFHGLSMEIVGRGIMLSFVFFFLAAVVLIAWLMAISLFIQAIDDKGYSSQNTGKLWFVGIFATPIAVGLYAAALPNKEQIQEKLIEEVDSESDLFDMESYREIPLMVTTSEAYKAIKKRFAGTNFKFEKDNFDSKESFFLGFYVNTNGQHDYYITAYCKDSSDNVHVSFKDFESKNSRFTKEQICSLIEEACTSY